MRHTIAQNLSRTPMPGIAIIYEWIIHPIFLRFFTGFYRFSIIYKKLIELAGNPAYGEEETVKILDMACGTFWFGRTRLKALLGEGIVPKIFGADISENLIEAACKIMLRTAVPEGTWHLSVADAQALKFPDEMFNEIWICGALHQIPIPEKTIDEIARLLLPGGLMFCQTFLETRTVLGKRFQLKVAKSGFDLMNRKMLDKKLKEKGLTQCGWTESGMTGLFVYRKNAPAFEPSDRSSS